MDFTTKPAADYPPHIPFARELFYLDAVVLDTETTGFKGDDEILAITLVSAKTGAVLFDSLIKATKPCSPEAELVHGITPDRLVNAPTFAEVSQQILYLLGSLGDRPIVAYNADFDVRMIKQSAKAHGINMDLSQLFDVHCLMKLYAEWRMLPKNIKLSEALVREGFDPNRNNHSSLGDAYITRQLLARLAGKLPPPAGQAPVILGV